MITVEAVTSLEKFRELENVWNPLVDLSDSDHPFMRFEWFSFFWPKFCLRSEPLVLVFKVNGVVKALLPLMRTRTRWRGLPVRHLSFMANYFSIRAGLIMPRGYGKDLLEPAFRFLRGAGMGYDILNADLVVKGSDTDRMLRGHCDGRKSGFKAMSSDCNPCISVKGGWEEYLQTRSKHQRFNVRHLDKTYSKHVKHSIRTYTGGSRESLEQAAETMFTISRNSWKFSLGTAICNDPEKMGFYRDFLRVAAEAGWLRLRILDIDGKPAAFSYELRYKNKLYILKISFDNSFRKLAPGAFLMNNSIRECFETGLDECELLGAGEEWKLKMCDQRREHVKYWIYGASPYGSLLQAWENNVVAAAKYLAGHRNVSAKRDREGEPEASPTG